MNGPEPTTDPQGRPGGRQPWRPPVLTTRSARATAGKLGSAEDFTASFDFDAD